VERLGAGGGAGERLERRGAVLTLAAEKQSRGAEQAPEEEEEGRGSEGPCWNFPKSQGLLCEVKFPTDPEL
jgi:hypothetical protein